MRNKQIVLFFLFLLFIKASVCQDLKWEWASFVTTEAKTSWFEGISCDFNNNLYVCCPYDTLVVVGDTMIYHPEHSGIVASNCIILKFNTHGEFINLIDIYTIPGSGIYNTISGADDFENMYFAASFSKRVFVQDTMINHCNTPFIDCLDGLIVKLENNCNIKWVRTIGGTYSDYIRDFIVCGNGNSYVLSEQLASQSNFTTVSFFLQDTVYADQDFTSVSKLDKNGNMVWRNDFFGKISSYNLILGEDEQLYFWGTASSDIIFGQDTIVKPTYPNYNNPPFFACLTTDGIVKRLEFVDFLVYPRHMDVNGAGEIFISGAIYETLIIGQDTIVVPGDLSYRFLGKLDTLFQPIWYHVIPTINNQQIGFIDIELDNDNLFFGSYSNRDVHIADTILDVFYMSEGFVGIFDENGELLDATISKSSREFRVFDLLLDKCKNPILAGSIRDQIYLHNDTAQTFSSMVLDGAIVKIRRNDPPPINIGPDTSSCIDYTLVGPEGYLYYSLNDSMMEQNFCTINKSGTFVFGCTNEGCWSYDTINIDIHPGFEINIGNDTTIFEDDTITFSIQSQYDSIRWFDGSGSNTITVFAKDYNPGTYSIWVDVFDGPCSDNDTLHLTIKSNFGIEENDDQSIYLYPNPFHDKLTIKLLSSYKELFIYDMEGNLHYSINLNKRNDEMKLILSGLKNGIYFIKISTNEGCLIRKLISI